MSDAPSAPAVKTRGGGGGGRGRGRGGRVAGAAPQPRSAAPKKPRERDGEGRRDETEGEPEEETIRETKLPTGMVGGKYHVVALAAFDAQERPGLLDRCERISLEHIPLPAITAFPDPLPQHPASELIQAFQDSEARRIYLFLPFPGAESWAPCSDAEQTYYAQEQLMFRWECQLLILFLSVHSVVLFFAGARFPAPILQTLRSLQSAKAHLIETGALPHPFFELAGAEGARELVPSLAFVMQAPAKFRRGEREISHFETAMDAQVRQMLDDVGCCGAVQHKGGTSQKKATLFVLHPKKCVYTLPEEGGVDMGPVGAHLTALLEVFSPSAGTSGRRQADGFGGMGASLTQAPVGGQASEGWDGIFHTQVQVAAIVGCARGSGGADKGGRPIPAGVWYSGFTERACALFGAGALVPAEDVGGAGVGVTIKALSSVRGIEHEVSMKVCASAFQRGLVKYAQDAKAMYTAEEHRARMAAACAVYRAAASGPAAGQWLRRLHQACEEQWGPDRRRCERQSLAGRQCVRVSGHEGECDSGAGWLGVSGCGRLRRWRCDPFTLQVANDAFYLECEAEEEGSLACTFEVPLVCLASQPAGEGDGEAEDGGDRVSGQGMERLVCRIYVCCSRSEFLQSLPKVEGEVAKDGALQVVGCAVPAQFAQIALLPAPSPSASGDLVLKGRQDASGGGRKKKDKVSGGAEAWPSLAPSLTVDVSGDVTALGKGKKGRVVVKGGERSGERDSKRPLNPLEDALQAMYSAHAQPSSINSPNLDAIHRGLLDPSKQPC